MPGKKKAMVLSEDREYVYKPLLQTNPLADKIFPRGPKWDTDQPTNKSIRKVQDCGRGGDPL